MKKILLIFVLIPLFLINSVSAQYQGPVPQITSGYGANGSNSVSVITIANDHWVGNDISIFYPTGTTTPVPTLFYSHAYGGNDASNTIELFNHLASRGYAVVFVPYKTAGVGVTIPERYATLHDGFIKAARTQTTIIDTTRVGFVGHSFGGGATPRLAFRAFTETNWGANGKFMYCSAPWYSFELGTTVLPNFPSDCNLLTVLYDGDTTNDHRMGMDIFNNINLSPAQKDCIIVYSNTVSGYNYVADHSLVAQYNPNAAFDALDYYVSFRLIDALADYSFTGNATAQNIALGNGSAAQINMGGQLVPLSVSDNPSPIYQQSIYQFPCNSSQNERVLFCQDVLSISNYSDNANSIQLYPNPAKNVVTIEFGSPMNTFSVVLYNQLGNVVYQKENQSQIDISNLASGVYLAKISFGIQSSFKKIIKL